MSRTFLTEIPTAQLPVSFWVFGIALFNVIFFSFHLRSHSTTLHFITVHNESLDTQKYPLLQRLEVDYQNRGL
jgi:hypothetical protein